MPTREPALDGVMATCTTFRCGNELDPSLPYCSRCGVPLHPRSELLWSLGFLLALVAAWAAAAGAIFVLAGWSPNFGSYLTITLIALAVSILIVRVAGALDSHFRSPQRSEVESTRRHIAAAWASNICPRCRQFDVAGLPFCPACGNKQADRPLSEGERATSREIERAWVARRATLTRDLEQMTRELKQMGPEEKAAVQARAQAKLAEMNKPRKDGG